MRSTSLGMIHYLSGRATDKGGMVEASALQNHFLMRCGHPYFEKL